MTQPVDELWFVPTYAHPFGQGSSRPTTIRVAMCELGRRRARAARSRVSRAEETLAHRPDFVASRTRSTSSTTSRRRAALAQHQFVIGGDILGDAAKWYHWDEVVAKAPLIVIGRSGHPVPPTEHDHEPRDAGGVGDQGARAVRQAGTPATCSRRCCRSLGPAVVSPITTSTDPQNPHDESQSHHVHRRRRPGRHRALAGALRLGGVPVLGLWVAAHSRSPAGRIDRRGRGSSRRRRPDILLESEVVIVAVRDQVIPRGRADAARHRSSSTSATCCCTARAPSSAARTR